jgi:hypothetical protein
MNEDLLLNRRDFMAVAALTAAGAIVARGAQLTAAAPAGADEWFDKPMRWVQLVLVDNDPGNYDPQFWLDLFKRMHADAICLSAGGCIAYYPTKIPYHYQSAWMKPGMDPFGELMAGCRKLGMVVVARTDAHSCRDDAAKAHPEWIACSANGQKRPHGSTEGRWITCAYGPYNFQFMTDVHKEIVTNYKVDGIFTNRWNGSGMCYCDSCKKQFQEFAGMDLPGAGGGGGRGGRGGGRGGAVGAPDGFAGPSGPSPVAVKYREWTSKRCFDLWKLWDGEIRKIHAPARFIANTGGGSSSSLDMVTISQLAPTLFADHQSRRTPSAPWDNGKTGKEFRAAFGRKPIVGIASLGIDDSHRWKDSIINDAELRIWVNDGVANGLRPWIVKFCGQVSDTRWIPAVEKMYEWQWRNEKYLRNEVNLARVGMVYSQQTAATYGRTEAFENGLYQALIEARIPFEMVHDRLLDNINQFKLICLPNTACLSDAQCDQLRAYVRNGGSIFATFETSLYDEHGQRRQNFGLADLFGVSAEGNVVGPVKNSYMRIETDTKHPILRGLEDAGRIINTSSYVPVKATAQFSSPPLSRIPSYPDLPMEEVYPRIPKTDIPEVFLREVGQSRIVYFPGDIERIFGEIMATDHGTLLRNAVEWATNEPAPVTVSGQGMFDVTMWQQKESLTVHLVNLTNPMAFKAPYRELIPSPPQQVSIKLPAGKTPKAVKLLVSGQSPQTTIADGRVNLRVDSVLDHEVVAVDL